MFSDLMEGKPTVLPFSNQVMEGIGLPVALHSRATFAPICTFLSLGNLSILAGAKNEHGQKNTDNLLIDNISDKVPNI